MQKPRPGDFAVIALSNGFINVDKIHSTIYQCVRGTRRISCLRIKGDRELQLRLVFFLRLDLPDSDSPRIANRQPRTIRGEGDAAIENLPYR